MSLIYHHKRAPLSHGEEHCPPLPNYEDVHFKWKIPRKRETKTEFVSMPPLPHIKTVYEDKIMDRSPGLRAAGKLTDIDQNTAEECLRTMPRPPSPPIVRRFRGTFRPDFAQKRVFYGIADDPELEWAEDMIHGVQTDPSQCIDELINPPVKSLFKQRMLDRKEKDYASHKKAPLGRSHDQSSGLPPEIDKYRFTFGIKSERAGCTLGEMVNPNKSRKQVDEESAEGLDLYKITHLSYLPAEQKHRDYDGGFDPKAKFGIETPQNKEGLQAKKALTWLHGEQWSKATPIVSKRLDDFREKTQHQLGKTLDPIKDTMHVGPDHVFGVLHKPDEYGVSDLLHGRVPHNYLRGTDRQRGLIAAMRQHLKKCNYHHFQDLETAFRSYDKDRKGYINLDDLRECCIRYNLPVQPELLEQLMAYCDTMGDGNINYKEFVNFLNWKDKMVESVHDENLPAWLKLPRPQVQLQKQIDQSVTSNRTTSSMINGVVGPGGISTKGYRTYGVPCIRSDLPAPVVKRISDRKNYGDEGDAGSLCNPSMFTNQGVYERDVLRPRDKFELRSIFRNIGLETDWENFDKLFEIAASRDPHGLVSVESFRSILDEAQAEQIKNNPHL